MTAKLVSCTIYTVPSDDTLTMHMSHRCWGPYCDYTPTHNADMFFGCCSRLISSSHKTMRSRRSSPPWRRSSTASLVHVSRVYCHIFLVRVPFSSSAQIALVKFVTDHASRPLLRVPLLIGESVSQCVWSCMCPQLTHHDTCWDDAHRDAYTCSTDSCEDIEYGHNPSYYAARPHLFRADRHTPAQSEARDQ